MNYSQEAIKKAYDELSKRRDSAAAVQNSRVEEIKRSYPEIYSVYEEILSTKDRLSEVILSRSGDVRGAIERIREGNLALQKRLRELLSGFGYPEDYLDRHYSCPICRDLGVKDGNRCECVTALLDKYAVEEMNRLCSIKLGSFADFDLSYYPERYQYGGSTYNPREIAENHLRYCMEYAKKFPDGCPSLFMLGHTGLGKTFLSGCVARELQQRGFSVAFDLAQNYLHEIEKEHFGRSDGDTVSVLMNADLVILDDLGSELPSNFNAAALYNIINPRLNAGKPIIVSSNLSIEGLSARYDDRIMSRLMGMFKTLRFIGEDIRQIKRRQGIFM